MTREEKIVLHGKNKDEEFPVDSGLMKVYANKVHVFFGGLVFLSIDTIFCEN
jgi:hypothetical protein